MTNAKRVRRAHNALRDYGRRLGHHEADLNEGATLVDLLTDLRHWCEEQGTDMRSALNISQMHFEAETEGDS